ncbi:MAG: LysR family transcriptional regulator [Erysipelotrichaceae bacterium]
MDAKKLEILIQAIDMGSFSKAAESVGYTQSGITHLVNSLEKEIGFRLVNRTFNGISLTKEGEILLPYIRDFLEANDDLNIKIKEIKGEEESTVRVAAYASIAMRWMPEVLYRYKRVCPEVDVDLRMVDNTLEPFELLREGKTDVIFASRQDYDNVSWTPLYNEKMYAIVPESYPNKEYFDIADFKDKDFLMPYGRFDIDVYRILGDIKINEICNQVDDETLIRMVSKGLGITMMSEMMIRGSLKGVKCIPIKPEAIRQLGMGTRFKNNSRIIEELKNCVVEYLQEG